jgi:hypothetical protein
MTGIVTVAPKVRMKKSRLARNFPTTNSQAFIGKVSSISQVFSLRSCAQVRIVIAGMKMHSIMGMFAKYGRISATGNVKKEAINNPTLMDMKTIMNTYPIGDLK